MFKKKLALLLALVMLLAVPGVCFAMLPITQAMIQTKQDLEASGKMSNDYLDHSIIDLVYVSSGTVTTYTYSGNSELLTMNTLSVTPTPNLAAADKITRYVFNLTNQYRPNTEIAIAVSLPDMETVNTYTYGTQKHEAMYAIITGIPDCLANPRLGDSGGGGSSKSTTVIAEPTWPDKYSPGKVVFTSFQIGTKTYQVSDGETQTTKTMDVAPEITDGRTYMPVRYLAYSLGVPEDGVQWDGLTQTVTISNDGNTVQMIIGNTTETVNSELIEMDTAPYIKNVDGGGRTMLPARWVAEPLGAEVEWDEETQQATIKITQENEQAPQ